MRTLSRACLAAIVAAVSIPTTAHATPSSSSSSSAPITSSSSAAPSSSSSSAAPSSSSSAATTTTTTAAATTTTTKAPPQRTTTTTATTVRPVVTFPTCPDIPPEAPPIAKCPPTTTTAAEPPADITTTSASETQIVEDTPIIDTAPPAIETGTAVRVDRLPSTGPTAVGWFIIIGGWFLINGVVLVISIRRNWRGAITSSLVGTTCGVLIGLALTDNAPVMLGIFAAFVDISWLASRIGQALRRHDAALERSGVDL